MVSDIWSLKRVFIMLIVVMVACVPVTPESRAANVNCPATVSINQKVDLVPPGWSVSSEPAVFRFINVTFSSGPPAEQAFLVPSSGTDNDQRRVSVWSFHPEDPTEKWISCQYSNTILMLSRKLPPGTRQCEVVYDLTHQRPVAQKVTCK